MAEESDTSVQTLLEVIREKNAHREVLMRDLLDFAERGQDTGEVRSALRQTEGSLERLRQRLARLEAQT